MAFEPKKFDQIVEAMVQQTRQRTSAISDFEVGSVARTLYESFAYEIALLYEQMHLVYLSGFVATAEGSQLDMVVAILGIKRGSPDFAEGVVTFNRDSGIDEEIEIPIGTLVTTKDTEKSPKKSYKTIEVKIIEKDKTSIEVKVQAIERGEGSAVSAGAIEVMPQPVPGVKSVTNQEAIRFTGKRAETDEELRQRAKSALLSSGKASIISIENALLSLPGVKEVKVKERFEEKNYGLVDVFIDGIDFNANQQFWQSQIDRVRAAGVFVRLQSAVSVEVHGEFRIEIDPSLKLSSLVERRSFEENVQQAIATYMTELRMGQSLLFAKLIRRVLSLPGVNDVAGFAIATSKTKPDNSVQRDSYTSQDKQIEISESEKFNPTTIRVVSEIRELPIQIQFQSSQLDREKKNRIIESLKVYFSTLQEGQNVKKQDIETCITPITPIAPNTLKLSAKPWSQLVVSTDNQINVSFAEKAQFGENLFAYRQNLKLIAASKFIPNNNVTEVEKERLKTEAKNRIIAYLDKLKPEEDIDLIKLRQEAQGEEPNLTVTELNPDDFRVVLGEQEERRIQQNKIAVKEFEKAELAHFCITSEIEPVAVTFTQLSLKLEVPNPLPQGFNQNVAIAAIKEAVLKAIHDFPIPEPGKNLSYTSLKQAILTSMSPPSILVQLPGVTNRIEQLTLVAISNSDRRRQTKGINTPQNMQDIHVRSVEKIEGIAPPADNAIAITITQSPMSSSTS